MISNQLDARVRAILPDEFSATAWAGAIAVLKSDNPIRAHLFAAAARELLGHILHSMAPDDEVTEASWFAPVPETTGPTRRQRATFAVQGGLSDARVTALGHDHGEMHAALTAAFKDLNQRTHVRPDTLLTDDKAIAAFAEGVADALLDFLATISDLRDDIARAAATTMRSQMLDAFLKETIGDIDILSTHSMIEGVEVEEVEVEHVGAHDIAYKVSGAVYLELLYGSGSDRARGDGASLTESFPFTCKVMGDIDDIARILHADPVEVDTSSWYE